MLYSAIAMHIICKHHQANRVRKKNLKERKSKDRDGCDLCVVGGFCSRGSRDLLRLDVVGVRETVKRLLHTQQGNTTGARKQTHTHTYTITCTAWLVLCLWFPHTRCLSVSLASLSELLMIPLLIAQHPLRSLQAAILNLFPDRTRLSFSFTTWPLEFSTSTLR